MNIALLKLKLANEPVWIVQAVNAAVGIVAATLSGGSWGAYVPSLLVALSAPLIRSRVTPVRVVADLVNTALHTTPPGPGPAGDSAAAAVVSEVVQTVEKALAPKVLPPATS